MNVKRLIISRFFLFFLVPFMLVSCQPGSSVVEPVATPQRPTVVVEMTSTSEPDSSQIATAEEPVRTPTDMAGSQVVEPTVPPLVSTIGSDSPETAAEPEDVSRFRVVFVEEGDVLNVRSGPGAANDVIGELSPGETGVEITGAGHEVQGSLWLPVSSGQVSGWVNGRFLTELVGPAEFCSDSESLKIIDLVRTAIETENGDMLAQLVADGRGLRIRRHWWNPEVKFELEDVRMIFDGTKNYSWGNADGSGQPINGTLNSIINPLFKRNLSQASELGCNEILHGGTAGLVTLSPSYDGINYYSLYRPPGPDEFELDWGTWVIGVEKWQGRYYLSYLLHYEWEI